MGGYFGVKGVEAGFEVLGELLKGFLRVGYRGIGLGHLVIPGFSIGGSSSSAHFVQGGHDLSGIRGVEGQVQDKVGLHGLDPLDGIIILAREIGREGGLQFRGV